eukprot:502082_1
MVDSPNKTQRKYSYEDITSPDYVDPDETNAVSDWIHALLDITNDQDLDLFDELKSGILLCKLINLIKPNTVPNFKESSIAFFQRENIQKFIQGCINIGMDKIDTFDTNDLFEQKRLSSVMRHMFALNETAKHIGFEGPFIENIQRKKKEEKKREEQLHEAIISFKDTPIVDNNSNIIHKSANQVFNMYDKLEIENDENIQLNINIVSSVIKDNNNILKIKKHNSLRQHNIGKHVARAHSEEFSLELHDNQRVSTYFQSSDMYQLNQTIQHDIAIEDNNSNRDKYLNVTNIEKSEQSDDDIINLGDIQHTQTTNNNTNTMLIVGGVAVVGIALFVALKRKAFF